MAIRAALLRVGQRLEGNCGRCGFVGRIRQVNAVTVVIAEADGTEQEICPIWCDPLYVDGKLTPRFAAPRVVVRQRLAPIQLIAHPQPGQCWVCGQALPARRPGVCGRPAATCSAACRRALYTARARAKHARKLNTLGAAEGTWGAAPRPPAGAEPAPAPGTVTTGTECKRAPAARRRRWSARMRRQLKWRAHHAKT